MGNFQVSHIEKGQSEKIEINLDMPLAITYFSPCFLLGNIIYTILIIIDG